MQQPIQLSESGRTLWPVDTPASEVRRRVASWKRLQHQIGDRYSDCRLGKWVYHGSPLEQRAQQAIVDRCKAHSRAIRTTPGLGGNVLLFGPAGTGKDFLAAAMMRLASLAHGVNVGWVNGLELHGGARDLIGTEVEESEFRDQFTTPDILVISDPLPPKGGLTEHQINWMFRIIDHRYRRRKPVWMTLNVANKAEAETRMGVPNVGRMTQDATVLLCNWSDYRGLKHGE